GSDLRRESGRHHPRVGGGHRHRSCRVAAARDGAGGADCGTHAEAACRSVARRPAATPRRAHRDARSPAGNADGVDRALATDARGAGEAAARAGGAAAAPHMKKVAPPGPTPPNPSLFRKQMAPPVEPPPTPRAFIPPAPERTVNRPRRMPGIDELPRPAQAEL